MERIKYKGCWFVPNNVEQKYFGEVSYTKETGLKLELYGLLNESIILGVTNDGTRLTLCGCFVSSQNIVQDFVQVSLLLM